MKILDTSIRDGSYAVDFKFSCEDVKSVSMKLEKLSIPYMEIGHGQGLNASSSEHGLSLNSDIEYMETARRSLHSTKFGFFCIPGIARLSDLKLLKDHGGSFVRIGINADKLYTANDFVNEAKKLGLTVMVNFMKTYILPPQKFAQNVKEAAKIGADYVYIVDSAGCMLPEQIKEYYTEIRNISEVPLGFHGHNNLGLAVFNSLTCVQLGFDLIDCTFQGIGRSIGNTPTEMFVMALKKSGISIDIDIPCLLEYGYTFIKDSTDLQPYSPLDLICGYAGFHSGFLKDIYRCCSEHEVDPLRLILAYANIDKTGMDYRRLQEVAQKLPKDEHSNPYSFRKFFTETYLEA